jgi:uncharacterized protein (TIGR03437 family)
VAQAATFPFTLGDTTISITDSQGGINSAPLYYVSPSQASFLIPAGVASGAATVKVLRAGATVLTGSVTVASISPGLYSENGNGAGVAAATYVRASAPLAPGLVFNCQAGIALSCRSTPLSPGAETDTLYIVLYGTGVRAAKSVQVYVAGQSVIALIPENAARAIDAVARLQTEAAAAQSAEPAASAEEQFRELEKRATQLCASFHKAAKVTDSIERQWLIGTIKKVQQMINRLELEIR